MTLQRRDDDGNGRVRRAVTDAEHAVQRHLTVDVNAGMADLMARRARRDRDAQRPIRRLLARIARWPGGRRHEIAPLVVIEHPHVVDADGRSGSAEPPVVPRGRRLLVATALAVIAIVLCVGSRGDRPADLQPSLPQTSPTVTPATDSVLDPEPVNMRLTVDVPGLLSGDAAVEEALRRQVLNEPSIAGRRVALVLTYGGLQRGSGAEALAVADRVNAVLAASAGAFHDAVYRSMIGIDGAPDSIGIDIYLVRSGHSPASPETSLELEPVSMQVTVDAAGLLSGHADAAEALRQQVLTAPRMVGRRAGLVLTYGGALDRGPASALAVAAAVNAVLGASGATFDGTAYRQYVSLAAHENLVTLDIYLWRT
ncbi:hypothetical protein Daura_40030 [Dactylosporangium aurantiacum]|uniref:Uncharacterized protein n=1 Tax=Dactylosporangium aurantiacum TaxID=35754 RepID=A0A9Q9IEC6_9ACTN|nr:hypothetical protein [Dactylosporangium aurantiacum]MDG6101384.1 hypothetical protein [Dactylosporangium aurantiacum]UWZ52760.1 hypothetical protein Daura_40030 [Dactylosporangium aurantiacum]